MEPFEPEPVYKGGELYPRLVDREPAEKKRVLELYPLISDESAAKSQKQVDDSD